MDTVNTQFARLIHLVAFDTFESLSSSQASDPTSFLTSPSRFRNPAPPNTRSTNTIDYNAVYRELLNLLESQGLPEEQKKENFMRNRLSVMDIPPAAAARCAVSVVNPDAASKGGAGMLGILIVVIHEYRGDVDKKYFNQNLRRDNDERRILYISDVLQVNGREKRQRERALVEAHVLGLVFAIGETREMTKRHDRAKRLRVEREEALERMCVKRERDCVARAEYAARMHPLVKLVLPNQYHVSVRPTTRSHRGMRYFRKSRARHLAWMA